MPTNNPNDRIYGTFAESPFPNQAVSLSIHAEDVGKLPKEPLSVPLVFEGLISPPQTGLLVPPSSTANTVAKFTLILPDASNVEGKGSKDFHLVLFGIFSNNNYYYVIVHISGIFTPFEKPSLVIKGMIIPPPLPNQAPKFTPERADQMTQLLMDGVRGALIPSAPDTKPMIGLLVPGGKNQMSATFVPDKISGSGPGNNNNYLILCVLLLCIKLLTLIIAIFRPLENPNLIIYGEFTSSTIIGGSGTFKVANPDDLSKLPAGNHGGTISQTSNLGIQISGVIKIESSSSSKQLDILLDPEPATTTSAFDYKFTEDKMAEPISIDY